MASREVEHERVAGGHLVDARAEQRRGGDVELTAQREHRHAVVDCPSAIEYAAGGLMPRASMLAASRRLVAVVHSPVAPRRADSVMLRTPAEARFASGPPAPRCYRVPRPGYVQIKSIMGTEKSPHAFRGSARESSSASIGSAAARRRAAPRPAA